MPYDPKAIANYFLDLARAQEKALTPLKIQKLVYFANGWHLAIKGVPLINEQVEAWRFGPVIPSLYSAFRAYGECPVTKKAVRIPADFEGFGEADFYRRLAPSLDDIPEQTEFTKALLDRIWEIYGDYSAIQLSNLTHQSDTPWRKVFDLYNGQIPKRTDIPPDLMRDHFLKLARSKATAQ